MLPLTKRQREILDYLNEFIQQHGYAPSLEEIGRRFGLSSLATVHKHLTNLQEKGFIKRAWNRSRSVEMVPTRTGGRAVELPLLGFVAAGLADRGGGLERNDRRSRRPGRQARHLRAARPRRLDDRRADSRRRFRRRRGSQDRRQRRDGHRAARAAPTSRSRSSIAIRAARIRLQPANATMQPIFVDPGPGADSGRRRRRDAEVLTPTPLDAPGRRECA